MLTELFVRSRVSKLGTHMRHVAVAVPYDLYDAYEIGNNAGRGYFATEVNYSERINEDDVYS